ncbi:downstream target of AGL15-4 [Thalictrum thalictroides]|uniref:Downstream target of AGL15-4 n=1 Tax=Thalictrum thalictroides TaxID=46969 RepID=A0A7J6V0R3_THATH|nr:downstream target of AGL15-4 [Thalictrum thalictroides]
MYEHDLQQFRAPPPSPIAHASARRSLVNEDEISDFLEHSLRVPNLVLPDQIFPKEVQVKNLPELDFDSLVSAKNDETIARFLECVSGIGCFQLVNHGVSSDLIQSVSIAAAGIFGLPPDKKTVMSRSSERMYGFEEFSGHADEEEETENSEEFVWCRDEGLKSVMEGIRLQGFSNFSKGMENLSTEIEKVAHQVLTTLLEHSPIVSTKLITDVSDMQDTHNLVCYLHKHHRYTSVSRCDGSLKSDFFRMLIRGYAELSHSLCIHVCDDLSDFHVYSKKGWVSFTPNRDALVMTVGDQIQARSGGLYKNVIGRPIMKTEDEESISMAFLFSPPANSRGTHGNRENTISLRQQFIFALFLTLIYHVFSPLF